MKKLLEIMIWLLILKSFIILNSSIIYILNSQMKKNKKTQKVMYNSVIISNFAANIIYGAGCIVGEITKTYGIDNKHFTMFLKSVGELACIFGAASLSLLQFWKLRRLNINNKLICSSKKRKCWRKTRVLPFAMWSLGAVVSTSVLTRCYMVELARISLIILGVFLTIIFSWKVVTIISKHRHIMTRSKSLSGKSASINKSQSLLKKNCVLIVILWLPTLIGQIILNIYPQLDGVGWLILIKTAVVYPIAHPILYLTTNREIRKMLVKKFIKCQSKRDESEEEFYLRLQVRKRFRRSVQIEPFVIHSNN